MPQADCHPDREHRARGLCGPCHSRAMRSGTLDQHERRGHRRSALAVAEDVSWIIECGCRCHSTSTHLAEHGPGRACPCGGLRPVAERLGVKLDTLRKALTRARQYQAA